jgi:hypothetical protein
MNHCKILLFALHEYAMQGFHLHGMEQVWVPRLLKTILAGGKVHHLDNQ